MRKGTFFSQALRQFDAPQPWFRPRRTGSIRKRCHLIARRATCNLLGDKHSPVFVLGNQKSGTTAIAQLLSLATNKTYSHDMLYRHRFNSSQVLQPDCTIRAFVEALPLEFYNDIIKEPNFSFLLPSILREFPNSKVLFIVRNPISNVRSIFDRLGISGNYEGSDPCAVKNLHEENVWLSALKAHLPQSDDLPCSFVASMSLRWLELAKMAYDYRKYVLIVRYEDFLSDKPGVIKHLCEFAGLDVTSDTQPYYGKQFQPRGKSQHDSASFFSYQNLCVIRRSTHQVASLLYSEQDLARPLR